MDSAETLRIARWLPRSAANGPGERFVLWVQGCPLHCPGCWNPDTWSNRGGELHPVGALLERMLATPGIEGVTFTGGEPLAQPEPLAALARGVRAAGLSTMVFTGYEFGELQAPAHARVLEQTDVLVSGRYVRDQRTKNLPWRGSRNQQLHFLTARYSETDIPSTSSCEIHIDPSGAAVVTGFPPEGLL